MRTRFLISVVATMVAFGCTDSSSGCSGMKPIPTGRYAGPKSDNALNVRITGQGLTYINQNWSQLVEALAPGGVLDVEVPCTEMKDVPLLDNVAIADNGNAAGSGKGDGKCPPSPNQDKPSKIGVKITSLKLVPQAPNRVSAEIGVTIDTGEILAVAPDQLGGLCDMKCTLAFNNKPDGNTFSAVIALTVDTKWDNLLSFNVAAIDGTDVCGSLGAPGKPGCLDPDQIDISRASGNLCPTSLLCTAAGWDPVKGLVLKLISPLIQGQIRGAINAAGCEPCGGSKPACPQFSNTSAASSCVDNICRDTVTNKCVPRVLGAEGRLSIAPLLSSFGVAGEANLDLSVALGSTVTVDQGITLGTRVGVQAVSVAGCVTPQPAPSIVAVPAPNFDAEATPGSMYHVGLSLSASFLNVAFHQAQQAGALCLQVGSESVGLINTGLFKTFLPSLGKLAARDGKEAPMMVALRPGRAPLVTVGLGTYDPVTKRPIKPLLTLLMTDLSIDIYAMIDDRYTRLFTLTADITLPLSLIFDGCDKITPALGDLKMLVTNIRTSNSEMLAEDPKVLEDLIPAVIGLAEPALADALKPFELPKVGTFKLKVNEAKGLSNIVGSEQYYHLGLYATLLPEDAMCAVSAPETVVALRESVMPKSEEMRLTGRPLPWPKAILEVKALGKDGSAEFAYRIDDGLWSSFVPALDGVLEVSHPRFLLQGTHLISIRSRVAEDPHGISPVKQVAFVVDFDAPTVTLTADPQTDRLVVTAHDVVSADSALQFAYGLGNEAPGAFGPAREISLGSIEPFGGVTVLVRDELGNVGQAVYRAPTVALRADTSAAVDEVDPSPISGCSATGGLELLGLLALAAIRRRRS